MMLGMRSTAWLASAVGALAIGACGGGGGDGLVPKASPDSAERRPSPTSTSQPAQPDEPDKEKLDPADVKIVRAWADTLRRGDVRAAARYFALPSIVANGTAPIRLKTRPQARFFNRALPCGAKLIQTEPAASGFFIATFRLTERPGDGECGNGAGGTARTAFRVRGKQITDWLRVQDIPSGPETLS